jgi:hypothetical protein
LGLAPIADEKLAKRLLLNFHLIVINLDSIGKIDILKNFKSLETLLIKSISFTEGENSSQLTSVKFLFFNLIEF